MITHLNIQGLALIESLSIDFTSGFNVITGETGAGKSILIRALNFLMGEKAQHETVRQGCEHAIVSGDFLLPQDHMAREILTQSGIPFEIDGEDIKIIIRRKISQKGRAQSWINDVSVTTAVLMELGSTLVDIFGQHENQKLMKPEEHTRYLDLFLPSQSVKLEYEKVYSEARTTLNQIRQKIDFFERNNKNLDYLQFRLEELKKFLPEKEDFDSLQEFCMKFRETQKNLNLYQEMGSLINSEDYHISDRLKGLIKLVSKAGLLDLERKLIELVSQFEDISFEISQKTSDIDFNEKELEDKEQRIYQYQDLFRKHGAKTVDELLLEFTKLETEVNSLSKVECELGVVLHRFGNELEVLQKTAVKLSSARQKTMASISKSVAEELMELSMKGVRFDGNLNKIDKSVEELSLRSLSEELNQQLQKTLKAYSNYSEKGAEKVEFLLSTNPGEPLLPLMKIASGGELSRIMLALKKTLAVDAETCVLVFDEIDTGISGSVADKVGRKLKELSHLFQVICISHLPQVAVYADSHFLVEKKGKNKRTETSIFRLTNEESAKEIARLLSGEEVTPSSLKHAKELLVQAHSKNKKIKSLSPKRFDN